MTASAASLPVARLRTPGELAAAVPWLCGFVPTESLVLLSLRGARSRLGLTVRVDLPPPGEELPLAEDLARRLVRDGAHRATVLVHTGTPGALPRAPLVRAVVAALEGAGVEVLHQLLVRDGRWWSYDCSAACCPPAGTPLPAATPALDLVSEAGALSGRAVLPSRAALQDALAAQPDPAVAQRLVVAQEQRRARVAAEGRVVVRRDDVRRWRRALAAAPGRAPSDDTAAGMVAALEDRVVRDAVLTWALDDAAALLWLLHALAGRCCPPHDADVCALLAWTAHVLGDGALAHVALDRALATDPGHGLSRLGREALDGQVPPDDVRALLTRTRDLLCRTHPELLLRE